MQVEAEDTADEERDNMVQGRKRKAGQRAQRNRGQVMQARVGRTT